MKRQLMEILACPICKHSPLDLYVFEEKEDIDEGLITCSACNRWYPIIEEIPHMLPDKLRDKKEDLEFLKKWQKRVPKKYLKEGKPFSLK